jgi:homoserine dehydrogenase
MSFNDALADQGGGVVFYPSHSPLSRRKRRQEEMECTAGIGLLGCGTVGASVAQRLLNERSAIERRSGIRYDLRGIAVRDLAKERDGIDRSLLTADARSIVDDPRVDVIVECIGGTHEAAELVERALERGRTVITANKDLIATQGPRLQALASARGARLRYEASVCGAIPIVRMLDESLAGDRIDGIAGVMNGTCNFILCAMEQGAEYGDALAEAQRLGYAEADPSSDVEGRDAAHKLAVLMQLAFGLAIVSPRIRQSGIAHACKRDVARAQMLGYRIRLVAAATRSAADVAAVLVPHDHPFASLAGPENIVRVASRDAGELVVRGRGAGGAATASAVLGDVVSSLRALRERHDAGQRGFALDPALELAPLFADLVHHPELPRYHVWDDTILDAPLSHENRVLL